MSKPNINSKRRVERKDFFQVNKKIRVDGKTGEYFELGRLAPKTFDRIMQETKAIQVREIALPLILLCFKKVFKLRRRLL